MQQPSRSIEKGDDDNVPEKSDAEKYPISESCKALYPILSADEDATHIGVACILMRFTCFGSSVASPFSFHTNPCGGGGAKTVRRYNPCFPPCDPLFGESPVMAKHHDPCFPNCTTLFGDEAAMAAQLAHNRACSLHADDEDDAYDQQVCFCTDKSQESLSSIKRTSETVEKRKSSVRSQANIDGKGAIHPSLESVTRVSIMNSTNNLEKKDSIEPRKSEKNTSLVEEAPTPKVTPPKSGSKKNKGKKGKGLPPVPPGSAVNMSKLHL